MTQAPPVQQKFPEYRYEDEISLIDLFQVLLRRWVLIVVVIVACLSIGLLYAFNKPVLYEYTSSIDIGYFLKESELNGQEQVLIEQPNVLLAKIKDKYIPLAIQAYLSSRSDFEDVPDVQAQLASSSQIISLSSKGTKEDAEINRSLHQAVLENVQKNHQETFALLTQKVELQQLQEKADLNELKNELELIQSRLKRNAELSEFLSKQLEEIRIGLRHTQENRVKLNEDVKNGSTVATSVLFLMDSIISHQGERLGKIEERLKIELPDARDNLKNELAGALRALQFQRDSFTTRTTHLGNLPKTRMLTPTTRSKKPVGITERNIIALSLVLGLMLGVFGALFAEFLSKARAQMKSAAET